MSEPQVAAQRLAGTALAPAGSRLVLAEWTAQGAVGEEPLYQAPLHAHPEDEAWYVLEGTLRHTVGTETKDLKPGDCRATPRGVAHGFSNPHSVTARALVILSPDTIGARYFHDVGAIVNAGGPPDRQKLLAVMAGYGLKPEAAPAS